jgi:hypothetical protein
MSRPTFEWRFGAVWGYGAWAFIRKRHSEGALALKVWHERGFDDDSRETNILPREKE